MRCKFRGYFELSFEDGVRSLYANLGIILIYASINDDDENSGTDGRHIEGFLVPSSSQKLSHFSRELDFFYHQLSTCISYLLRLID